LLDTGNFSDNPGEAGEAKTAALLQAMERLGYQAANVGEREVRIGYDDFQKRVKSSRLQFVSANFVLQETQQPVFSPHIVVDAVAPDGQTRRRVGVVGAVRYNPLFLKDGPEGKKMVIAHPVERVRKEVEALRAKKVDLVVLLVSMHKDDARRIAAEVEGIDYILGAYGGTVTAFAEKEGDCSILYCGNQGKNVGETRIFLGAQGGVARDTTHMHLLTGAYPADPEMLHFVQSVPLPKPPAPGSAGA
jgi:2',3'-cyclic-nucleotide 2'-phosphodiesterase (5'-nucleotidase family)